MDAAGEIARHDMALGLISIFRPLADGVERREIVATQQWSGDTITIRGIEMGERDLTVLLALLAIATGDLGEDAAEPNATQIQALDIQGTGKTGAVMEIRTSVTEICRRCGISPRSRGTRASVRVAVERLAALVVRGDAAGGAWRFTHLIAGGCGAGRNAVQVTLSYRLARAVLGTGSYARVSMPAYRALPGGLPRILHVWLSAWMCGARARVIGLGACVRHIWPTRARSERTERHRWAQMEEALDAQRAAGWTVTWQGQMARIERRQCIPALPRRSRRRRRNHLIQMTNLQLSHPREKLYKHHY